MKEFFTRILRESDIQICDKDTLLMQNSGVMPISEERDKKK